MNSVNEKTHRIGHFKIYLIGKKGVGKSTFINSLNPPVYKAFDMNTGFVLGVGLFRYDYPIKSSNKNEVIIFQIWVSTFDRRFELLRYQYLTGSEVILIMFDVSDLTSLNGIDSWMKGIGIRFPNYNIPIMLLGNKTDLISHLKPAKALADSTVKKFGLMGYYEISASKSMNVEPTIKVMADIVLKNYYPNLTKSP